jgi:hypothetical protein
MAEKQSIEDFIEGKLDQSGTGVKLTVADGSGSAYILYQNGMALDSAYFLRGMLKLSVKNTSTETIDLALVLPAFVKNGNPLTINGQLAANQEKNFETPLEGYKYNYKPQDTTSNFLRINGTLSGSSVPVNIDISYAIENTMFSYIAGILPTSTLNPLESTTGLPITDDVKDFRDKLKLYDAELKLKGDYFDKLLPTDPNKPFKVRIDQLNIVGYRNKKTEQFSLKLNGRPDNNLGPLNMINGHLEEPFTSSNSNLSEFLSFLPDSIVVIAKPTLNPDKERGAGTNRDSLQFGFELILKSVLSITDLIVTDTLELSMDKDARDNIKNFRAATIYLKIDNKIAFGGKIVMDYVDSNFVKLFSLDTINFEPANVDANGFPIMKHSEPTIELDSMQVQQLAISENIIMTVVINTTDSHSGQKVVFTSKDWLSIISFCKVKYHLNLDED